MVYKWNGMIIQYNYFNLVPNKKRVVLDYQTVSILTYVLTGNLLQLLYSGCKTISVFHLDILSCWSRGIKVHFYIFWSFFSCYHGCWRTRRLWITVLAVEINGIGDRWSGDTTMVDADTHTLWSLFGGLPDLGHFPSSAEVSRFLEYQHLDQRNSRALKHISGKQVVRMWTGLPVSILCITQWVFSTARPSSKLCNLSWPGEFAYMHICKKTHCNTLYKGHNFLSFTCTFPLFQKDSNNGQKASSVKSDRNTRYITPNP